MASPRSRVDPEPPRSEGAFAPYAAPRAPARVGYLGNVRGRALPIVFAIAAAMSAFNRGARVWGPASFRSAAVLGNYSALVVGFVVELAWVYLAWSSVPPAYRGKVTPRAAAVGLVIPGYNVYWKVAMNLSLCNALNAVVAQGPSDVRAPRTLSIVLNAVSWVGGIFAFAASKSPSVARYSEVAVPLAHTVWCVYMIGVDRARGEVAALEGAFAPDPGPLDRLRERGIARGGTLVAVLFVGFIVVLAAVLALWRILAPR
jgi:hypothetical protein